MYGARISLLELVDGIRDYGVEPLVVCPARGDLTDLLDKRHVAYRVVTLRNWRKIKFIAKHPISLIQLYRVALKQHIDLMHCNEFWINPFGYHVASWLDIPCLCHFRCSRGPDEIPPAKLMKYSLHKVQQVIAVSHSQLQVLDFLKQYDLPVEVVYNGVDVARFQPPDDKRWWKKNLGLNPDLTSIGLVGLITKHKGQLDFINAVAKLIQRHYQFNAIIVGSPREPQFLEECRKLAAALNVQEHILFYEHREDIESVFKALDIHVTPSFQEAFGRVNIEAMACGVPVVAYAVGGIPEIVTQGLDGLLIQPGPESLAQLLGELMANPARYQALGREARRKAVDKFSIKAHVSNLYQIYQAVLANADRWRRA